MNQTQSEVWVSGSEIPKYVIEMFQASAEEHNFTLWINGQKIHQAKEEPDGCPKSRRSGDTSGVA